MFVIIIIIIIIDLIVPFYRCPKVTQYTDLYEIQMENLSMSTISYWPNILLQFQTSLLQNTLEPVSTWKSCFSHITPVLFALHWLPIHHRISFNIATIAFKVLQFQQPSYLVKIIPSCTTVFPCYVTLYSAMKILIILYFGNNYLVIFCSFQI